MNSIIPVTIEILRDVLSGKSSRSALRSAVEKNNFDREEESELYYHVFEILRRLNVLDLYIKTSSSSYSLKKISSNDRSLLRIATFLLKIEGKSIENVHENLSSYYSGISDLDFKTILNLINDVKEEQLYDNRYDLASNLSIEFFVPTWIARKFLSQWSDEFARKILTSSLQNLPMYVRVNTIKANLDEILQVFDTVNISYSVIKEIENIIKIEESESPIPRLQVFQEGKIVIQQKASALVSHVLDPKEGEKILDMCASPGGKTSHIVALLGEGEEIDAVDMNRDRVQILRKRLNLLGINSVKITETDARKLHSLTETRYDKILLDPPCSGSGTYSSRPENKWRMNQRDLQWYTNLQSDLLDEAALLLKNGGFIVYSTCSLFFEENHNVILSFLEKNPDYKIEKASPMLGIPSPILEDKAQELYPHLHETEGFFIAKIKKFQ